MGAALWTTPSLRLRSVVTGTSQLPAPFKPNPTLLRLPLPSQCPTESTEDILPHPVPVYTSKGRRIQEWRQLNTYCHQRLKSHELKINIPV